MFCENLIRLRKEHNLTQAQASKLLQVSRSGYANWEQGTAEPSIEALIRICLLYDISSDELIGLTNLPEYIRNNASIVRYRKLEKKLFGLVDTLNDAQLGQLIGYIDAIKAVG